MLRKALMTLAAAAPLALVPPFGAHAAPQVLVLVATANPVELDCADGQCSAEFTSLCLQEHRAQPARGTPYLAFNTAAIQVIGERRDGSTVALPTPDTLAFAAERGHTAVKVTLPVSWLRAHDLASVQVKMDDLVTLVPTAVAGDPQPLSDVEIEVAAGPLTQTAALVLDGHAEQVDAARLTAAAINALPARPGRLSADERDAVWQTGVAPALGAERPGAALARQTFDQCNAETTVGSVRLRQCLSSAHDMLINPVNVEYWDAVKIGS